MNDDQLMSDALESSVLGRGLTATVAALTRASEESRAVMAWRRWRAVWSSFTPAARMAAIGGVVLIAAATNVVLIWNVLLPGGYSLMVPALAAVFGALALALAASGASGKSA